MSHLNNKAKGLILAITGASLWGASGAAVQFLFRNPSINEYWLVGLRLLGAGLLLVVYSLVTNYRKIKLLFSSWRRIWYLIIYSFVGMGASQLAYYVAVKYSNAPTATVIQYLAPVFIISYLALRTRSLPRRIDVISIIIALIGTLLLVTNGHLNQLALSPLALTWGLLAAVAEAINTIMPSQLFRDFGTITIVGWSMLIAGLAFLPLYWTMPTPVMNTTDILMILFIIIFGTLLAYTLYLASINFIAASTTGMLGAFEPLIATLLAIFFLSTPFNLLDWLGSGLIILATLLQAWPNEVKTIHQK